MNFCTTTVTGGSKESFILQKSTSWRIVELRGLHRIGGLIVLHGPDAGQAAAALAALEFCGAISVGVALAVALVSGRSDSVFVHLLVNFWAFSFFDVWKDIIKFGNKFLTFINNLV